MYLVRRINRDHWSELPAPGFDKHEVPAELLTRAFKDVRENRLSLWTAEDTADAVADVALALATSKSVKTLAMFDIAWFAASDLASRFVATESSDGDTRVDDLVARHVDAAHLDGRRLADIAELVAEALTASRVRRFMKDDLGDLLLGAVEKRRVREANLPTDLKSEITLARARQGAR